MSERRARLVGWRVQPIVMADDGDTLTPVPVQPVEIPAAQWQEFKDGGDDNALVQVQAQLDKPPT